MSRPSVNTASARSGMTIGEPLEAFQGVLRGVPTYLGASNPAARG